MQSVVVNIVDLTVMGRIASLVLETNSELTALEIENNHFVKFVSAIALAWVFIYFGVVSITSHTVFAIGIIVANVPQGLLATGTVSLTLACGALATKKVCVKIPC